MSNKEEISNALIGLAENEEAIEKVDKDVELYRAKKMEPIYAKRDQLIEKVPSFWKIVLSQHSNFANFIRASDFKYVDCIENVHVEWDEERNFKITIKFEGIEGDFESQTITKSFRLIKIENDMKDMSDDDEIEEEDEIEKLISDPVDIIWPKSYDNINPSKIENKKTDEGKKNYRKGMKTIFGWFKWTGLKPGKEFPHGDSFAELFADDLYPYCVKYYTEAQRDLQDEISDDDDSGDDDEPLDLSDAEEPVNKKQRSE